MINLNGWKCTRIIKKCKANETKEKNAEKELNYSREGAAAIRGAENE